MTRSQTLLSLLLLFFLPSLSLAAEDHPSLPVPLWTGVPFALLLLAIAVLPLAAGHFWHSNRNKGIVALLLGGPVILYLLFAFGDGGLPLHERAGAKALTHALDEYVKFILLLGSLYTISGGIVLTGDLRGRPLTNGLFLVTGAVLANAIGTTGASMLLIRPYLRTNQQRQRKGHLPIFFIFMVSNLGGLLTPLGDPPLYLGFMRGVDFFWTMQLWREWLVANGCVLAIFLAWDRLAYRQEKIRDLSHDIREVEPLRVRGLINFLFLGGVVATVLFRSENLVGREWTLHDPYGELLVAGLTVASLLLTPKGLRALNQFTWGPIIEVAVLFFGIFVTMVPALEWLKGHGQEFGLTKPWQYFWLTGGLSSVLDNAPTYLTFATVAAGKSHFHELMTDQPLLLAAISCGAVFMGANTYIGNGPNFMVKAIADEAGVPTPSFLGYLLYSGCILLPIFGLITYLFF